MARKSKKKLVEGITQACKNVGTYKDDFLPIIESLADIELQRDRTWKEFENSGGQSMVPYTNKNGSENLVKNPLLVLWNEQNKTWLAYRRDLGLTPAGLKKLNEKAMKPVKQSPLAKALKDLG